MPTERRFPIPAEVAEILRCPSCGNRLIENECGVACSECGAAFPSVNGVLRLVKSQEYAGSFGFQWRRYARTQLDTETSHRSENDFRARTGFGPEDLRGKLVLDVGCGMGRFADVAESWGATVVGIDLSDAVEAAAKNLAGRRCTVLQADIFRLPFAPASFDVIYSVGVLHHTPDCEKAFKVLPSFLKPGGKIAMWVYSSHNRWYRMSDIYRIATKRMPARLLHGICHAAIPIYGAHQTLKKIPVIGKRAAGGLAYLLPISFDSDPEWRVLDTFDWYSPRYQSKHRYEEVETWFRSCGLMDIKRLAHPVGMQGRRRLVKEAMPTKSETESCVG